MIKDIKQLTELYLHSIGLLSPDKSWMDFHDELILNASKDAIGLLADAKPKDKCKYALFINVDTINKTCEVKDYIEIGALSDWSSHLFWQGSGGAQSDKIRNTPHKIYSKKGDFSVDDLIAPLQTILNDYCRIQKGSGKNKGFEETGPIFWDTNKIEEKEWLKTIIDIIKSEENKINLQVKGQESWQGKFPSIKQGESVFIGLTIDDKPIGEYELFRRYLLFVRTRAGIQKGADKFKNKSFSEVVGICPSCHRNKPLLDQWQSTAELSFYQTTNENHLSYAFPSSAFKLCRGCSDLLYVFKQHLLETLTRKLGGNECLILPSIKVMPVDQKDKERLYENLKALWTTSGDTQSAEKRLLFRLGQLPSYATVTFVFGDYITTGKSQNVRRLDELNIIFPDVLPSRLSRIANVIEKANKYLNDMWSLTGRTWNCSWNIQDDLYLLYQIFYPSWEKKKKNKSKRRTEVERYLRAIFYAEDITYDEIAEDCYSNLLSAFKTSKISRDDNDKYALSNYTGNILSLLVFVHMLKNASNYKRGAKDMPDMQFEFTAMPDLGKFVEMHPLLKDSQYLAPFFVGCLFSYAENLQKDNSRLAAYNWLGTMALTYKDILQDIYPKVLNYITNKEKIVSSPRLQELTRAIAYYDRGKCDNDRVALVSFCHGWAVGRDFIYKKKVEESKTDINQ
ncbi:TM1802 family CRISPR-associated protein [Thermodesulfovibrio hydrogeniphilus]